MSDDASTHVRVSHLYDELLLYVVHDRPAAWNLPTSLTERPTTLSFLAYVVYAAKQRGLQLLAQIPLNAYFMSPDVIAVVELFTEWTAIGNPPITGRLLARRETRDGIINIVHVMLDRMQYTYIFYGASWLDN